MFKRKFIYQGLVQFESFESTIHKPVICGDIIKWLDHITVYVFTEKSAIQEACDILNSKYPEYKGMVQLW
jgi:hypothetical protein